MTWGRVNISNFKRAVQNPTAVVGEIGHQLQRVNSAYHRHVVGKSGRNVMDTDWDNLIILDACRFDMFRDAYASHFDGELERVRSLGSCTMEFLELNFDGRTCHDTVYVSANPHTRSINDETFFAVVNLFLSHWSSSHGTVHPKDVVRQSLNVYGDHPQKRYIVHFMQPHEPFIGDHSVNLPQTGLERKETEQWGDLSVWTHLRYGIEETTIDAVTEAYEANFEFVLPHVKRLVKELDGRTVITSDHGNLLGERLSPVPIRGYGHPWHIRHDALVDVPWLTIESDTRRSIEICEPIGQFGGSDSDDVVENRLQSLGYK